MKIKFPVMVPRDSHRLLRDERKKIITHGFKSSKEDKVDFVIYIGKAYCISISYANMKDKRSTYLELPFGVYIRMDRTVEDILHILKINKFIVE